VADSSNLVEIGTVGKMLGIGQNNFFAILQMNKVIYKKRVDDIEYYLAYSEYEKYFKSVPIPFKKSDGTKLTRNKLMFTQGGAQWAEKRFSTRD
jgi:phage antirepressor YoqD-like protein